MSKLISLTYYGMEGEGRTVSEAKKVASAKLEKLIGDLDEGPAFVSVGSWSQMIVRGVHGWESFWLVEDGKPVTRTTRTSCCHPSDTTRQAAIIYAVAHLLQMAWSPEIADDAEWAGEMVKPYMKRDDARQEVSNLVYWAGFQRRYKAARAAGRSDHDAHLIAGGLGHLVQAA